MIENLLISNEFIDVSFLDDSKALKMRSGLLKFPNQDKTTDEASNKPLKGAKVWFKFEPRKLDGELLDKSGSRFEIKKMRLFSDNFIEGIHLAIFSMVEGETSWFKIWPELHYFPEKKNAKDLIVKSTIDVPNEPIFCKLELLKFKNVDTFLEKNDFSGRVQKLLEIREMGNSLFRKDDFDRAAKVYKSGIEIIVKLPKEIRENLGRDQNEELEKIANITFGNCALCKIRAQKWFEAVKVLEDLKKRFKINEKIKKRLMNCYLKTGDLEKCEGLLNSLDQKDKNDFEYKEIKKNLEVLRKKEKQMEKKRFFGMFQNNLWSQEEKNELVLKKKRVIEEKNQVKIHEITAENKKNEFLLEKLEKGMIFNISEAFSDASSIEND